jgi:glycosyltransferase involved in cell wall biosynthesis
MKIKNSNLKASVLVANYNNSKFIDKCIKSIINQTYNNIEIIFIDDRSTDNSLKVAKKYSHKIKLISQKKKSGIGCYDQISTYYEGFKKSTGDIIFFLDSDDYFRKEKISILMNKFKNDAKIDILNDLPIKKFIKKTLFIKRKKKIIE